MSGCSDGGDEEGATAARAEAADGDAASRAPAGNRNNWRDGFYSRAMKAERRWIDGLIRRCLQTLREIDGQ